MSDLNVTQLLIYLSVVHKKKTRSTTYENFSIFNFFQFNSFGISRVVTFTSIRTRRALAKD